MTYPRLSYFEMRGRAEAIRIFLHAMQTSFDDRRIVLASEWEEIQPELPFGGLPIHETGDALICESHSILRYLGKTLAPATRDDLASARLDATQDAIATFQEDLWRFNWVPNYYDHLETYAKEKLRPRLAKLESWFAGERDGSPEWFGAEFSHVDCVAFCFLDEIDAFFPAALSEFSTMSALHARVAALPGVSGYLASSARPIVFGMAAMGPKVDPRKPLPADYRFPNPWTPPLDLTPILRNQRRLTELDI